MRARCRAAASSRSPWPRAARRASCADEQATALYRFAQEALTNVERHARARKVAVSLSFDPDATRLTVRDDGRGLTWPGCRSTRSAASACATCASALRRSAGSSALSPASAAPNWWQRSRLRSLQPVPPPFPQNLRSHDPDT
ncbi:ATP-binding protein [Cupriavidus basilensis]